MNEKNKDIALKAWEVYQILSKEMGESAWKIRSVYFATSAGIIAYTYNSSSSLLYLLANIVCIFFFLLESGYRRLQDQYIEKSIAIERTLNYFIADERHPRFPESIGTDVNTPNFGDSVKLLALKRIIFWLPYLVMFVFTLILFSLDIKKIE